jgi:hypothetical protein
MGLDIWFSEDIRNALLAADEASASTAALVADLRLPDADVAYLRAYREGYKAALCTVALAFGLAPQAISLVTSDRLQELPLVTNESDVAAA